MPVTTLIDELWRDMRIAARSLRRSPAFAVAASATLSLGFALTTTMFALAEGVLLKPLPYRDPERLRCAAQLPMRARSCEAPPARMIVVLAG